MVLTPEQPQDERDSVVQEDSVSPKKATKPKKKPAKKRSKTTTAKSKRRKPVTKTLESKTSEPPPPPLTLEELKEQGKEAKQELVNAVVEPAVEAVGSLSQTVRDTISGAFAGLLSRRRRD